MSIFYRQDHAFFNYLFASFLCDISTNKLGDLFPKILLKIRKLLYVKNFVNL